MASKKRVTIKLLSTAGTGCYYTTRKNPTNTPAKLKFKKYDYISRRVEEFVETKIK